MAPLRIFGGITHNTELSMRILKSGSDITYNNVHYKQYARDEYLRFYSVSTFQHYTAVRARP